MSKGKVDIRMGGRYRDADETVLNVDGGSDALKQYLQDLFNNATFSWSQIGGDITSNQELINYLNSLIDTINQNNLVAGDLITNELKAYIDNLLQNLTITWEQITGSPVFNQEFKDYIDNLISNLTIRWDQITGSPVLNQTLIDLLNQYKTDIYNSLEQLIEGEQITQEYKTYIDNILNELRTALTEVTNATTLNQTLLTEIQEQITELGDTITHIQEGDTITQEYKDYIEQKFTTIEQTIQNITEGAVITEEIKQYIDNSLTELKTTLQQFIDNSVGDAITEIVNQITNVTGEATRLISGSIVWLQNLDFWVSPLVYQILNRKYETGIENLITIPANAENNPRFAVIYADIFGNVGYLLGEAAAAPVVPHVNDNTQIALWTVYIPALGTAPEPDPDGETDEITTVVVYDENIEWTTAKVEETGITIDLADTTSPAHGAKHISLTFAGGTNNLVRKELKTETKTREVVVNVRGNGATLIGPYPVFMSNYFYDTNTDYTADGVRHIVWYKISKGNVQAVAKSRFSGIETPLTCLSVDEAPVIAAGSDLSVTGVVQIQLTHSEPLVNDGEHDLFVKITYTRFEQLFITGEETFLQPAAAQISLTAPAAVAIEGGTLNLSLKPSIAWLNNTGLILELYNAAAKVGSLALLPGSFYGFNPANLEYQRLVVPLADFAPTAAEITALVIRPVNEWPACVLDLDYITIQTGLKVDEGTAKPIETQAFEYRDITEPGQRYTLDLSAYFGYKVLGVTLRADADTITAKLVINTTPIVGLNPNVATDTKQFFEATAANTVAIGEELTLEIDGLTGDASAIVGSVKYVRV